MSNSRLFIVLAGLWSLFQLSVANLILLDSVTIRAVHLAFGLSLVYLSTGKQPLCALTAALAALYLVLDYDGISNRQGMPWTRDIVMGVVLVIFLLEAARRSLGPALPIIAIVFMLSSLFASSLPGILASKDVSLQHLMSKLTLSTESIYGVPLRVSADTVFLFVLFGAMLERAGGGKYFIDLAFSLLGRYHGGPAKAAVLASGLTGTVSGSSIANTVTTGTFTIPLMIRNGYPPTKAAAIEVAASTNGQLMPPIMGAAAFIIAEYCNVDYIEVVRAAILPALVSYLTLLFITHLEAKKLDLRGVDSGSLPPFWSTFVGGIPFLIPLGLLLYQLLIARHSANLAAYYAILALGGVMIGQSLYHQGSLKPGLLEVWEGLVAGGRNMMGIGVAVGTAGIIVGVVTLGLGSQVTEVIGALSAGQLLPLLLITAGVSLLLGMGLPTTANYIVMANLTAPVIVALAPNSGLEVPLLAAHLFCFYFGILADDTPPVGLAAYAASAIAKSPPMLTGLQGFLYDMRTAILPFVFVLNTRFLLIGVHGALDVALVFTTAIIGMFAFAAVLQNFFLLRNQPVEALMLLLGAGLLLFTGLLWVGIALVAAVAGNQWRRSPQRGLRVSG